MKTNIRKRLTMCQCVIRPKVQFALVLYFFFIIFFYGPYLEDVCTMLSNIGWLHNYFSIIPDGLYLRFSEMKMYSLLVNK